MTVLLVLAVAVVALALSGRFYSRFIARSIGEDPSRATPAMQRNDGRDYVPTPTPVVFAHHFASIAGAGPIIGPVIAIIYGWLPALIWVIAGGVLIGAVHDYLATYMATREGGQSIATIARRMLGTDTFVAFAIFLVVMLALVCAAFLNFSAVALTSMLPFDRLDLPRDQTLFRVVSDVGGDKVVIGGIASMSVVCITAVAPLIGYLYLKRKVAVWKCSLLAIAVCAVSITIGVFRPIAFQPIVWKLLLSGYVLVAAGVPVWIFLQSRDFINVHILYVGMAVLLITLLVAGVRGASVSEPIPALSISDGTKALGPFWPMMFIVIACGAVSGFHSLCAGGTTCKQLTSEPAARQIGYSAMLLESFLAVCVIAALMIGAYKSHYIADVHPGAGAKGNTILGFAMAVGNAAKLAFGVPVAAGALAGMVLLEGFLVTTLDTAIRLTRYLVEEIWRTLFARYDVFAAPAAATEPQDWGVGDQAPTGAGGLPITPGPSEATVGPVIATRGWVRSVFKIMRLYWFNSAIAVALMLVFALTGGQAALWKIFATSNQLLAAMVLLLAAIWLLRRGRRMWFALIPGLAMLVTTIVSLVLLFRKWVSGDQRNTVLLTADVIILLIVAYMLFAAIRTLVGRVRRTAVSA